MDNKKVILGDTPDASPINSGRSTLSVPLSLVIPVINAPSSNLNSQTSEIYDTKNIKRGVALIFNQYIFENGKFPLRDGTNKDRDDIENVLQRLDFDVRTYDDQTHNQIMKILKNVAGENHTDRDCIVVVMMSHGDCGYVYASDKAFPINQLWNYLMGYNCPTLIGKPKLFIINACRGKQMDTPVKYRSDDIETTDGVPQPVSNEIPQTADLLVMYSTYEGYVSWRNPEMGSWFIQSMCAELLLNSGSEDLLSILTNIARRVAYEFESFVPKNGEMDSKKQISCFISMLTKSFFFTQKQNIERKIWSRLYFSIFDLLSWISNQSIWELMKFSSPAIKRDQTANSYCYADISKEYKTTNKNRGIALIFNHQTFEITESAEPFNPRDGTQVDCENIKKILIKLKFDVRVYDDLKRSSLMEVLEEVANEDHTDNDCIAVFVLSHGVEGGIVYANDLPYPASQLWNPFMKCKSLAGKPKLFFINACRGSKFDSSVPVNQISTDSGDTTDYKIHPNETTYYIPKMADLLIMHSTFEGHRSWLNKTKGSWFVQAFYAELSQKWESKDLMTILTGISRRVAYNFISNVEQKYVQDGMKQMPSITSTLTKKMYFK